RTYKSKKLRPKGTSTSGAGGQRRRSGGATPSTDQAERAPVSGLRGFIKWQRASVYPVEEGFLAKFWGKDDPLYAVVTPARCESSIAEKPHPARVSLHCRAPGSPSRRRIRTRAAGRTGSGAPAVRFR